MAQRSHSLLAQLVVLVIASAIVRAAQADLIQFEILGENGPRLITLDTVIVDQSAYAPLQNLVEQAGGSYNVLPTRLRVDLGGSTAWLRAGESRVHALSIFSLRRPIAEDASGALIAVDDISDFFLKSFRVTVRSFATQPAVPAATPPGEAPATPETTASTPLEATAPLEQPSATARESRSVTAIIIDPGHGGYDAGIQTSDAQRESEIVLAIAARLKSQLDSSGGPAVILTRQEDAEIPLEFRARTAQSVPGALFISIHAGTSLSPAAEGVAVLFPTTAATGTGPSRADARLAADCRRLAEAVGAATAAAAGVPLRGIVQAPLKLLSELQMPAIQIEVGCLTSAADSGRLASDEHLTNIATGIVNGITIYLSGQSPVAPSEAG